MDFKALFEAKTGLTSVDQQAVIANSVEEWHYPCPWCGGKDRFIIQPAEGTYSCKVRSSGCGKQGDVLDFLQGYCKLPLQEALNLLGCTSFAQYKGTKQASSLPQVAPALQTMAWSAGAEQVLSLATKLLFRAEGRDALAYLHGRGLTDETLQKFRIGFIPLKADGKWEVLPFSVFGINPQTLHEKQREKGGVTLPDGIYFPQVVEGNIWKISVKRPSSLVSFLAKELPEGSILNSVRCLFNGDSVRGDVPVCMVESALCAMSIAQEVGDGLIIPVATGGTMGSRTERALQTIRKASYMLQCFDNDDAGHKGAAYWIMRYEHEAMKYAPMRYKPLEKDPNDTLTQKGGEELQEWVRAGMQEHFDRYVEEEEQFTATFDQPCVVLEGRTVCTTLTELQALQVPPMPLCALDLETTGLDARSRKIITLAFGTTEHVYVLDIRGIYTAPDPAAWIREIQRLICPDRTYIGHNLAFDWLFLKWRFHLDLPSIYDTMIVEKLLTAGLPLKYTLQDVASVYGIEMSKEARSQFTDFDKKTAWNLPLSEELLFYIHKDITIPYEIYRQQQKGIATQKLQRVVLLEKDALIPIANMTHKGIRVDVPAWRAINEQNKKEQEALNTVIQTTLGKAKDAAAEATQSLSLIDNEVILPRIKLSSGPALTTALGTLGIFVESTSAEALKEVEGTHEVVGQLLQWKELHKWTSTYGEAFLEKVAQDGRIHAGFNQLGAYSGRMSSAHPNLQNIPRPNKRVDFRKCFIAAEGHSFVRTDLSNIELRIAADFSRDEVMLQCFAEGKDLHSATARFMFNLAEEVDPKTYMLTPTLSARSAAKEINFGLLYGMGVETLADRLGLTDLAQVKEMRESYFRAYPRIRPFMRKLGDWGIERKYAVSASGRRRNFVLVEELLHETSREALNHPIQGTGADILKQAMIYLYKELPEHSGVVLAVHDELILETPDTYTQQAGEQLQYCFYRACKDFLKIVTIPKEEITITKYWVKD